MSEARNLSQLWRFIDDSLRSHTEFDVSSLSKEKEKEKEVLLALSQVYRRVQVWNHEEDGSDSDTGLVTRLDKSSARFGSNSEENDCLSKIVVDLVYFLTFDSKYIRHLAVNVLIALSDFVARNESNLKAYFQFLCVCLDSGVNTLFSCSSTTSLLGAEDLTFVLSLKDKLKSSNWSGMASVVQVLRSVLKNLTQNFDDDQITSVCFDSVNYCLANLPWDSFDEILGARNGSFEIFMFLGNVIQLLCSSVVKNYRDFSFAIGLVPKLLCWCLGKPGDCGNKGMVQYFRHKLLVFMIKISTETSPDCSVLVLWLELLQKHFVEFLQQPITSLEPGQNESLEGSPFLLCVSDEGVDSVSSSLHVQRRAVFLFLRCSFSLIDSKSDTNKKRRRETLNVSTLEFECCASKRGLVELNNWLHWHFSTDVLLNEETYSRKCVDFTVAFLKLYIHEDNLLFRMLLQLLSLPNHAESQNDNVAFQEAKPDVLFHFSNLFNNVHLFHLFLAELHYDHQVLLDYLISKDTGTNFAEYLLRCLRLICDSWKVFTNFSVDGNFENRPSHKKRKYICMDQDYKNEKSSLSSKNEETRTVLGKKSYYDEAKECLIALLVSVENLHQKKLFPYNPKVLLKRLRAFQELCCKEEQ